MRIADMRKPVLGLVLGGAMLALAACGGAADGEAGADPDAAQEAAAADGSGSDGSATAPDVSTGASSTEAAAAAAPTPAPAAGATDLTAYIEKFPFDKVNGVTWTENPTVLAALRKTVTDAGVREAILETPGPSAPIELIDGKVSAWACEQHSCNVHQWLVMVDPKSGAADVCYYNEQKARTARWFLANGKTEIRPGNCQLD